MALICDAEESTHKPKLFPIMYDNRKIAILFLTSRKGTLSNQIAHSLFDWLKNVRCESVMPFEDKITTEFINERGINFIISYNYTFIIQPEVLHLLPNRVINLHISYLPYNRGANPNIWSFIENTPAGVTIHEVDNGIDSGDILLQELIEFDYDKETLDTSFVKSHERIQDLFCKNWDRIRNGEIKPQKQENTGTFHLVKELDKYREIFDCKDSITVFLEKIHKITNKISLQPGTLL